MLDSTWRRVNGRHDNRDPSLPDSVGDYLPAVVGEFLCRQVWMRAFRVCGRSFDRGPSGADSLRFSFQSLPTDRTRRAARPSLFWFRLRRPTLRQHRLSPFGGRGSPSSLISIRAAMVSLRLESAGSSFVLHALRCSCEA